MAEIVLDSVEAPLVEPLYRQGGLRLFCRYVDDCFVYGDRGSVAALHDALGAQKGYLQYTIEKEIGDSRMLKYLDLNLTRSSASGALSYTHALKPANVRLGIPVDSFQPVGHKLAALRASVGKAMACNLRDEDRCAELDFLAAEALQHGHSAHRVNKILYGSSSTTAARDLGSARSFLSVPFSHENEKAIRSSDRQVIAWSNSSSLSALLVNVKAKVGSKTRNGIVYNIPCLGCGSSYFGSSARSLNVRLQEHQRAFKRRDQSSALVQHHQATGHLPNFDAASVCIFEASLKKRLKLETLLLKSAFSSGTPPINVVSSSTTVAAHWLF